jgi:hypothetical protein
LLFFPADPVKAGSLDLPYPPLILGPKLSSNFDCLETFFIVNV